jgi:hypothetical protein
LKFLFVPAFGQLGCNKASDAGAIDTQSNRGARIEASLDRISNVLQLNPDGTVTLDKTDPDYVSLSQGDAAPRSI